MDRIRTGGGKIQRGGEPGEACRDAPRAVGQADDRLQHQIDPVVGQRRAQDVEHGLALQVLGHRRHEPGRQVAAGRAAGAGLDDRRQRGDLAVAGGAAVATTSVEPKFNRIREARMLGYEGDACDECGNFTLVRNGTCLKCNTCGATSGCS